MRYVCIFCFIIIISACNRVKYIEFTGNMTGINSGAFVIKDKYGAIIVSEIINEGKFHSKNVLQKSGYYDLYLTGDLQKDYKKKLFPIYLEGGTYSISVNADSLYAYPVIKTDSKIQNELSAFYTPTNQKVHEVEVKMQMITALPNDKNSPVSMPGSTGGLSKELDSLQKEPDAIRAKALEDFVTKYPQNDVAAYILSQFDYKYAPDDYYQAYKKFSAEQKNTDDGKTEGDELGQLAKLAVGAPAPELAGKEPDGKKFNPKNLNKKIILVEFWKPDNEVSRINHKRLLTDYYSPLSNKKFTVVSFCLDTVKSKWSEAIAQDRMTWTQLSDLKGESSPNLDNWAITAVPTYDLVDGDWHIIKRNLNFDDVPQAVAAYLKTALTTR